MGGEVVLPNTWPGSPKMLYGGNRMLFFNEKFEQACVGTYSLFMHACILCLCMYACILCLRTYVCMHACMHACVSMLFYRKA